MIAHLAQSTAVALAASLLALALRRSCARARYWLWMAASVKFLVPMSLLVSLGAQFEWQAAPAALRDAVFTTSEDAPPPFAPPAAPRPAAPRQWTALLAAVWAAGASSVILGWHKRWRRTAAIVKSARPHGMRSGVRVAVSETAIEPAVFGILRPALIVPAGIVARLSPAELECVFAHELCHVRRRDNLTGAIHMVVETLFWFDPLVWYLGARLVEERECACDEEVLRAGRDSLIYARGLIRASRFCLNTPLPCVAGVTGGKLSDRVTRILQGPAPRELGRAGRAMLAAAAIATLAAPLIIGVANAPFARAQSPKSGETFDAVSIKPAPPARRGAGVVTDPGRITLLGLALRECISVAYGVQTFQITASNLPPDRYDIVGTAPGHPSRILDARYETMLQAMLADRFQLRAHKETKTLPVFAMSIAKHGPKLKPSEQPGLSTHTTHGHVIVTGATMLEWATYLTRRLARPVVDATGLKGLYDFELEWVPGEADTALEPPDPDRKPDLSSGLSIFMAMEEQLGLKLQSKKLPVETVVVDHAEKPSAN